MKVEQVMTKAPATCTGEDFVQVAASLMKRFDTGIIPVTEGVRQPSRLLGVVTDRDLCLKVLAEDRDPRTVRVGELMERNLTACWPSDTVETALARMRRARVRRLPVVNRDFELLGMLSLGDIVRHKAGREEDFRKTMAAICSRVKAHAAKVTKIAA